MTTTISKDFEGNARELHVTCRFAFIGFIFTIFFSSASFSKPTHSASEFSVTRDLVAYIYELQKSHHRFTDDDWSQAERKVDAFFESGASADLFIEEYRSTPLGATFRPTFVERLFLKVAALSGELNKPHYQGYIYPVEDAFRARSIAALQYLHQRGTSLQELPCCQKNRKQTFLLRAVISEDGDMVEFLIKSGVDIDKGSSLGSPLSYSIKSRDFDMAEFLISRGANGEGDALLHAAIIANAPVSFVKRLVDIGFGPRSVDEDGRSAINLAEQVNTKIYEYLKTFSFGTNPQP